MAGMRRWLVVLGWLWLGALPVANQAVLAHGHAPGEPPLALHASGPVAPLSAEPCPLCRAQSVSEAGPVPARSAAAPVSADAASAPAAEPRAHPATPAGACGPRAPPLAS
jgi:hypothetical protein